MPLVNTEPENLHKMFREMVFNLDLQHSITLRDISPGSPLPSAQLPSVYSTQCFQDNKFCSSTDYKLMPKNKLELCNRNCENWEEEKTNKPIHWPNPIITKLWNRGWKRIIIEAVTDNKPPPSPHRPSFTRPRPRPRPRFHPRWGCKDLFLIIFVTWKLGPRSRIHWLLPGYYYCCCWELRMRKVLVWAEPSLTELIFKCYVYFVAGSDELLCGSAWLRPPLAILVSSKNSFQGKG